MQHLGMPLWQARATAQAEKAASDQELMPRLVDFIGPWNVVGMSSDGGKATAIRLICSLVARVLNQQQHAQAQDKLIVWESMWLVHVHLQAVVIEPTALFRLVAVATYITTVFEYGNIVQARVFNIDRSEALKGLATLPSPFAFPHRQLLRERLKVHQLKAALHAWLTSGIYVVDYGAVMLRCVTSIRQGGAPTDQDIRLIWPVRV